MNKYIRIALILVTIAVSFWIGSMTHTAKAEAPVVDTPESLGIEIIAIIPDELRPPIFEGKHADRKEYAYQKVIETWGGAEWKSFEKLVKGESNWEIVYNNAGSGAYGIGQFMPSTWATVGCVKTDDPFVQIDCMIKYVDKVYDTPTKAWNKWQWRKMNDKVHGAWY